MSNSPGPDAIDSRILAFEQSWRNGQPPEITDYLSGDWNSPQRLELLQELICVDLEFRWRFAAESNNSALPRMLADYARSHPELGEVENLPLELIGEDYRVRQRWGDRPNREAILAAFPQRAAEIQSMLNQIDRELRAETLDSKPIHQAKAKPAYDGRPDPNAPLAYSDYKLKELIGAGLVGRVYRAWQQSLDRPVAVKYLRKSFHRDQLAVDRFLAEARTVAKLSHPRIVGVHGLGRTPQGGYFIVMDWIDGSDLARIQSGGAPVSFADALQWTREACEAIGHAHERNIIHCDLKPGNLLRDRDGRIHITDFGLSRSLADEPRCLDRIEGTAPFMAPEQVSPHWGSIDFRTDIYGLGAVLYTLLTGVPPCQGRTLPDVLANVVSANPITPPAELRPNLPDGVNVLCLRCLAKQPAERFASSRELAEHLEQSLAQLGPD